MNPTTDAVTMVTTINNITKNVTGSDATAVSGRGCILLRFEEYIPWDNPDNLISAEVEETTDRIKNTIVMPILFLIGGPANVINMAVFWKQGLRKRINLCLFCLSLADELYLIHTIIFNGERAFSKFSSAERYGPVLKFLVNQNMVGFYSFISVSQVMSAIIASERCFCVVSPLRSQHVLRTRTMGVIIAVVYVTVVGMYFVVTSRYYVSCALDPETGAVFNIVVGSEFYHRNKEFVNYLDFFVYGVGLPDVAMVVVISTTIVTTVKLRQSAAWRAAVSSASVTNATTTITSFNNPNTTTNTTASNSSITANTNTNATNSKTNAGKASTTITSGEVALTKMLIAASLLFIVCTTPFSMFRFIMIFLPEVTAGGRQHNTFFFSMWVLEVFSLTNSSFNFVVYYTMGSRFRDTLKDTFFSRRCRRAGHAAEPGKRREQRQQAASVSDASKAPSQTSLRDVLIDE